MVLRSTDLEAAGLDGFGDVYVIRGGWSYLPTGFMVLAEAVDQSLAGRLSGAALGQRYLDLRAAGWQREYRGVLGKRAADTGVLDPVVMSSVGEYADTTGAATAFTLLTSPDGVAGVTKVDVGPVGDATAAFRDTGSLLFDQDQRVRLTFRLGRFVGTVQVEGGGVRDPNAFEPATLTALAVKLALRIVREVTAPRTALAPFALRLAIPVSPHIERYDVLDGDVLAWWDETPEQRAERSASYADRTDVYRVDQAVPSGEGALNEVPRYNMIVSRFTDEAAATAWVATVPERRGTEPLPGARQIGDQSVTIAEEYDWMGVPREVIRVYLRVGPLVANLTLDDLARPPLDAAEALAILEAECLRSGGCAGAAALPGAFRDEVCPSPEAAGAGGPAISGIVASAHGDAGRSGSQPGPGPRATPSPTWRFQSLGHIQVQPVVADGTVFVGSGVDNTVGGADGALYALDAGTGSVRWCLPTGGFFTGAQAVAGGLVVGGQDDQRVRLGRGGAVAALDATSGEEKWRVFTSDRLGDTTVADDVVYVGVADGQLLALDLSTGDLRWRVVTGDDATTSHGGVAVDRGLVYVTVPPCSTAACAATGRDSASGAVVALDAGSGKERWRFDEPSPGEHIVSGPAAADGLVVVSTGDAIYGIDAGDGHRLWRFGARRDSTPQASGPITVIAPAVRDGVVYAVGAEGPGGAVVAIDAMTGSELWRVPVASRVYLQPAITSEGVYVADDSGRVHAITPSGGTERWSIEAGGRPAAPPVVVSGVVLSTSADGTVTELAQGG